MSSSFQSIHPFDQSLVAEYPLMNDADIAAVLSQSEQAFAQWRKVPFAERSAILHRVAKRLREEKETLARLITMEMGKTLGEATGEVEKCAGNCDHYAEHAEALLRDQIIPTDGRR